MTAAKVRNFGSPAILGSFVAQQNASRRKRGPVALRLQLWLDLPFSNASMRFNRKRRQFRDVLMQVSGHL